MGLPVALDVLVAHRMLAGPVAEEDGDCGPVAVMAASAVR
ncbi:hypothetical protein XHV734_0868 [Xanthomonas hortorum pv. vitians]|nr:hypothetical protein XHV734_0868 [Xanthomonas hortorum pv. vitians]